MVDTPTSDVLAYCSVVFEGGDPAIGNLEGQVGMMVLSPDYVVFGVLTEEIEGMIESRQPFVIQDLDFRLTVAIPNILALRIADTNREGGKGLLSVLLRTLRYRKPTIRDIRLVMEYADPEGNVHRPVFALPSVRGRTDPGLSRALSEFHLKVRRQMERRLQRIEKSPT
ncbi:MAG: hypothetical protein ACE5IB_07330 [Candidatus Geothermarchaeales archaeon]